MIDLVNAFRILNAFITVLSVPFSILLAIEVFKERPKISKKNQIVNTILREQFLWFSVGAIASWLLSSFLIIDSFFQYDLNGNILQIIFNLRNLILNVTMARVSFGFWLVVRKERASRKAKNVK